VIALYSQALIFTGEYYEATCLLNNIPTSYFYLSVCKGDAYFGLKKYKEAEKEYQDALLMNPNTFSAYFGLGKVNYQTRQYSESLKYFRSAEKLRPDDIHVMIEINNLQQMMALENNINIQGGEEKKSEPSPPATLPESTPAASSTDADKKNDSDSKDAKFESSPLAQPKKINTESKSEKRPVAMPKNMREVDVPNDNNCLFWSIIMGYLLPTLDHYAKFETAFQNIIGEKCKTTLEKKLSGENAKQAIFRLLKTYDVDKNSDIYKIPIMVNFSQLLRHRTVTEMTRYFSKEHKDELAKDVRKANWRQYARWMRSDSAWGGESEIKAISNILKKSITVYSKKYMIEYEYKSHDNPLYLVYTNATGNTHVTNHYHYLLDEALYKKHLRKESTLSTSAHSSLFKPKEKEKENDSESEKLKEQWVDQFIHLYF
jgi:tetratricopeptide (TPR) repeat protein